MAYVQQIIVKAMVHPYKKDEMIKADAFRGPLASSFKLHLQDLALFRDPNTGLDMDHLCLRTDGLADKYKHNQIMAKMLPDYGCLMLSPANLWQRDPRSFQLDANVISTVFNFQGEKKKEIDYSTTYEFCRNTKKFTFLKKTRTSKRRL